MVTEVLVKESLSTELIEAGAELTKQLDAALLKITASFWFYTTESNVWRLIIASPEVKAQGLRSTYKKVQTILQKIPREQVSLTLSDISLRDPSDPLILLLRSIIHTGSAIGGIRFKGNVINGTLIEDAYIYRLT